jgi:hypothetical protein
MTVFPGCSAENPAHSRGLAMKLAPLRSRVFANGGLRIASALGRRLEIFVGQKNFGEAI